MLRLADIAKVRRGFADPPQPMFRVNGEPAIGLAIAMRDGGDILALGKNIDKAMATDHRRPAARHRAARWSPTSRSSVESAIAEFMTSLWQAIAIIMVVSFISLGVRPGLVVALSIPLTLAIVFLGDGAVRYRHAAHLARRADHRAGAAGRRRHDHDRRHADAARRRATARSRPRPSRSVPTPSPMLTGTLVTIAGFVPIGFAASSAGEYTFSLFAVVAIALIVSWFVAVLFAPLLGVLVLAPPQGGGEHRARHRLPHLPAFLTCAMRARWLTIARHDRAVRRLVPRAAADPAAVLSVIGPARAAGRPAPAAECLDLCQRGRWRAGSTPCSRTIPTSTAGAPMSAAAPSASTCRSTSSCRTTSSAQAVIVAKDVAGARAAAASSLSKLLADEFPSAVGAGLSAGTRAAGRLAGAVPRQRPGYLAGARRSRCELAEVDRRRTRDTSTINFDWIEPARQVRIHVDQDEARLLGPELAGARRACSTPSSPAPSVTQVRDDIYLIDVVVRATDEQRVSLDTLQHPPGAAAGRAHRAAQPVRHLRVRARTSRWSGDATACRP